MDQILRFFLCLPVRRDDRSETWFKTLSILIRSQTLVSEWLKFETKWPTDSKREFGVFARSVRVQLLLNCYTRLQSSCCIRKFPRVLHTNRPFQRHRRYTKRLIIGDACHSSPSEFVVLAIRLGRHLAATVTPSLLQRHAARSPINNICDH